mgnify:CR=1 FL=1
MLLVLDAYFLIFYGLLTVVVSLVFSTHCQAHQPAKEAVVLFMAGIGEMRLSIFVAIRATCRYIAGGIDLLAVGLLTGFVSGITA